jgi:type I restriction enzyme S subunit
MPHPAATPAELGTDEELPEGWATATPGELVTDLQTGFACGKHSRDDGVPHLRPMNVNSDGRIDLRDLKLVPKSEVDRGERQLRRGDVVFNNTNSPALVGKTTHYDLDEPRAFSNHMTRVRLRDGIDPQFCALFLHQLQREHYFESACNNHVSQASIGREVLSEVIVTVPPLAKQRRIVAAVERVLAKVSAARERLERVPVTLKRFRQATLAAACSGRLTADWQANSSPPATRPSRCDDEPHELPDDWSWTRFGELCQSVRSGSTYAFMPRRGRGTAGWSRSSTRVRPRSARPARRGSAGGNSPRP